MTATMLKLLAAARRLGGEGLRRNASTTTTTTLPTNTAPLRLPMWSSSLPLLTRTRRRPIMTTTPIVPSPLASPVLLRRCATKADPSHESTHPTRPPQTPPPAVVGGAPAALDATAAAAADAAEDAAAALAEAATKRVKASTATCSPPRALFPWRHETAEHPLPRLVSGTPESQYHEILPPPIQSFIAYFFLNVPLWHVLVGLDWRSDWAESSSYAFSQGVAGIVSNVYRIPFNDLITEEEASASSDMRQTLDFQYPMPPPTSPIPPKMESERSESPSLVDASSSPSPPDGATGSHQATGDVASDRDDDGASPPSPEDCCPGIDQMLDEPLRKLFQSAHEHGKNRLQIQLQTTPTSKCNVVSIFCLPFVTRQAAERNPALVEQAREMVVSLRPPNDKPPITQASFLAFVQEQLIQHNGKLQTTVELQVLVECDEIFQVVDRETGQVLQGSTDGAVRQVWHLVRLETTTTFTPSTTFPYLPQVDVGNWIITDIDDLLGPKKWYHL